MGIHYKKLIHWKRYEQSGVKMLCGYDNYCVKTGADVSKVTCPKCLELIKKQAAHGIPPTAN